METPPADVYETARDLAASGANIKSIALAMGCHEKTFRRWREKDSAIDDAIEAGREEERKKLHDSLVNAALSGAPQSITAAIFLLKARHGYKEHAEVDPQPRISLNFAVPQAMTADKFQALFSGRTEKVISDDRSDD